MDRVRHESGTAVDTRTPRPVAAVTGALFGALSRVRGARIFHPVGVSYSATLRVGTALPQYHGVPLLERPGEHRAVVRFSRAVGLPEPLPDALGIAVRLPDLHGPGRHQDFLLVTSADGPLLHHLLLPGLRGFFEQSFSSLLFYRMGGRLRLVGARAASRPDATAGGALAELVAAAEAGAACFELALASPAGRWRRVGDLTVDERLPDVDSERLAFTPWHTGGGIRPVGPFMGLRRAAYAASQRQRGLAPAEIP